MPKAIRTDSENNRTTGLALPAMEGGQPASVAQQVHDGDTLNVIPRGNVGVRLLGIDTPEVSFSFPGPKPSFLSLGDARWNDFLTTALDSRWGEFSNAVSEGLKSWLMAKLVGQPGSIHFDHANRATDELRAMITKDMEIMGQDLKTFGYYLGFGFEVMDGYGRFLCTINRDQPQRTVPTPRPPTYNMRMLQAGRAFPYFIWPNINPWERPDSVVKAVIPPGQARQLATTDRELQMARSAVQNARQNHLGIFDAMMPCLLEPFELRFLSRRELPSRHVIDLTSDSDRMLPGDRYFEVPNAEDRLWVSSEYVPLFRDHGWKTS
ncbi:MAG: hypothetical protein R3C59_30045 [Planctomycetaceae bacterium]